MHEMLLSNYRLNAASVINNCDISNKIATFANLGVEELNNLIKHS